MLLEGFSQGDAASLEERGRRPIVDLSNGMPSRGPVHVLPDPLACLGVARALKGRLVDALGPIVVHST